MWTLIRCHIMIWIYTLCSSLSVPIFKVITVIRLMGIVDRSHLWFFKWTVGRVWRITNHPDAQGGLNLHWVDMSECKLTHFEVYFCTCLIAPDKALFSTKKYRYFSFFCHKKKTMLWVLVTSASERYFK